MKFQYLREFIIAARSNKLQDAASELGISLSVLSKHIKSMEMELGVPLFIRSHHTVLSQYGRIMLPYAQELVALQNEYNADFAKDAAKPSEVLKVALSSNQFREHHSMLLENFMLSNPNLPVETLECENSELEGYVLAGKCDLAFVRSRANHERNPELVYFPICADRMVAFIPAGHPLSGRESISFADLKDEKILLRSDNFISNQACLEGFEKAGISPNISFAGTFAVYDMVKKGEGISFYLAPSRSSRHDSSLSVVPVVPAIYSFVDLVYKRGRPAKQMTIFLEYMLLNAQV
ncbi:MAG: LysR substrate-binding domain-containing protein [Lachnospiraceae bacterium]|jgi:DNA-binding transcriptional LysR family regulator